MRGVSFSDDTHGYLSALKITICSLLYTITDEIRRNYVWPAFMASRFECGIARVDVSPFTPSVQIGFSGENYR